MTKPDRVTREIAEILFDSFGLPVPKDLPPPASPECFPTIFQRPDRPPLRLDRLFLSGAIFTRGRTFR